MKLTTEQKKEFFYNALCNGLNWIQGYGLFLEADEEQLKSAKSNWMKGHPNEEVCYEDVLMQILEDGGSLTLVDNEGDEDPATIDLGTMLDRMDNLPDHRVGELLTGNDDAETADVVLQTVFLNQVIYG